MRLQTMVGCMVRRVLTIPIWLCSAVVSGQDASHSPDKSVAATLVGPDQPTRPEAFRECPQSLGWSLYGSQPRTFVIDCSGPCGVPWSVNLIRSSSPAGYSNSEPTKSLGLVPCKAHRSGSGLRGGLKHQSSRLGSPARYPERRIC